MYWRPPKTYTMWGKAAMGMERTTTWEKTTLHKVKEDKRLGYDNLVNTQRYTDTLNGGHMLKIRNIIKSYDLTGKTL